MIRWGIFIVASLSITHNYLSEPEAEGMVASIPIERQM